MMSTRERWMVYPLLLLSVALALKANMDTISSTGIDERSQCRELVVLSPEGHELVRIGSTPSNRASIRMFTPSGTEAVSIGIGEDEISGHIQTRRGGQSQAYLGSDQEGGRLLLTAAAPSGVDLGKMAETRLKVGHDADHRISGLMIVDPDGVPLAEVGDNPSAWGFWAPWGLSWQATPAMKSEPDVEAAEEGSQQPDAVDESEEPER